MDGQPFQTIPTLPHHHQSPVTNFGFHDCVNSSGNFEQLVNLRNGGNVGNMFGFNSASVSDSNPGSMPSSLTSFGGDEEDSSVGRARMLISERRRWNLLKEKLLALRALVPNISKMDKASMVGDAVLYVQNLQMQIKKLKAEVAGLELSLGLGVRETEEVVGGRDRYEELASPKPSNVQLLDRNHRGCRKILQMDVLQLGEREFYVRSASNRGEGVAVALYRALESLTSFDVQSSNVTAVSDRFVLTFKLNDRKGGEEMNVSTLKKLVTGALLSQGFELKIPGDPQKISHPKRVVSTKP
ncbi:hypothetical protein NE237_005073 [Protea cynaroides]|uniref:BHLH domain-containing protein n=1 Tax=Protea cynaroides TaxID=273540 RepID=A0A9Q0KK49_9MAGN|nr:hypothetical protein NE237_005073 [Protea cynaroides]